MKPFDRPAQEPGGCECFECGVIFIGEPWHSTCAVCDSGSGPKGGDNLLAPGEAPQSGLSASEGIAQTGGPTPCK